MEENVVAMAHREQPQLGKPGVSYWGKSIYTTFGLEGVNDGLVRTDLMRRFLNWAWDMPTVTISNTTATNSSNLTTFKANFNSTLTTTTGVMYRWNFGDGSPAFTTASAWAGHTFACGTYTVWVDAMSSYGNHAIGSYPITLTTNCSTQAMITPAGGGTIVVNDAQGVPQATISVPGGAVSSDVRLVHSAQPMPTTLPSGLKFAGQAFNLDAYLGDVKQEGFVFSQPTMVTMRYTDAQIQGQYELGLKLYYWNGTSWVDAASSCSTPSTYVRDAANNTLSVGICHLTPFVLASSTPLFLPMIAR
jgi:hypothetical protein